MVPVSGFRWTTTGPSHAHKLFPISTRSKEVGILKYFDELINQQKFIDIQIQDGGGAEFIHIYMYI